MRDLPDNDLHDERALRIANLRYALTCHIPSMKRRVHIQTGYGAVEFYGPQARRVTVLWRSYCASNCGAWNANAGRAADASRRAASAAWRPPRSFTG